MTITIPAVSHILMNALHRLAVLAYLLSPTSAADPKLPPCSPAAWAALKQFADEHDLAREKDFTPSWSLECKWVRSHYCECRDACAPGLVDLRNLPVLDVVRERRAFARDFSERLKQEGEVCCWHFPWCEYVREDTNWRFQVYDSMDDAYNKQYPADRRMALAKLRALVGCAAYYAGAWPDPVPLWALESGD